MKLINHLFLLLLLFSPLTQATILTIDKVPAPLKPWVDWVLLDEVDYKCPFLNDRYQEKRCAWPTELALVLGSHQGKFSSDWKVYKESWVTLPGSDKHWPVNVTANDKKVQVIKHDGKPMIKLSSGAYTLKGELLWDAIPENLNIPANSGLITLTINDKRIAYPAIKKNSVWLKESDRGQKKTKNIQNKLDVQIFRQVNDEVPLQLITYMELDVSGVEREIKLPYALLADFIPTDLKSGLPARIEADGQLSVQVRPGRWHIELHSRYPKPLKELALAIEDKSWPASEIWVFNAQPYQRVVEVQNVVPIDPSQTNLPAAWKKLPAYQINQGEVMKFNVIQRGDPEPEPNKLQLRRELWLDFNGQGYTIQDKINGKMTNGWRLEALAETQLGQVKLNSQNQLITQLKGSKQQGVEVRKGSLKLKADSRFTGDINHLSAVGWQQTFHHVSTELNLPPGWRLLAATGVDNVPNSWISRWTLLDLFLVLIASLAISRLWSLPWGIFALLTLVLIWHETEAPQYIWLNIITAIALIKVLPTGIFLSFVRLYRNGCWVVLIIITIPFLIAQVRTAIYPQLEKPWKQITEQSHQKMPQLSSMDQNEAVEESRARGIYEADDNLIASAPKLEQKVKSKKERLLSSASRHQNNYSYAKKSVNFNRIDPNASVQTGLGAPQWHWNKIELSWNGSVDSEQQLNLWLLPPSLTLVLNFIRAIVVSILSLLMFGLIKKFSFKFRDSSTTLLLCLFVLTAFPTNEVIAANQPDYPEQTLLDELKERLMEAADCVPDCAEIAVMKLTINNEKIIIQLEVHVLETVAIPLPANYKQWFPNQVTVNKEIATALLRDNNGALWLNLTKGIHQVELSGVVPLHSKFTLPLPLKPHHVTLMTDGWTVSGVHEHGIAEDQLQFNQIKNTLKPTEIQALEQGVLPPFIRVERTLELGLDWRLKTHITRVVKSDVAVVLAFPLLKGESVITPDIRVKDDNVQVNMSVNASSFTWESILDKSATIELNATNTSKWTEVWQLDVSPIWHLKTEGIAVVHHQDQQGHWLPEWRPWPGERVSFSVIRPESIKGRTLTIDSSRLVLKPGQRTQETSLTLNLRSSKGTQHTLTLPKKVVLQSVLINNVSQPIRQKGQKLTLPIKPGKQRIQINWQQNTGLKTIFSSPKINIGLDSVNNHIEIYLGSDRWVLLTTGPHFGPAILFWGVLFVIVAISFGLGKIEWTPLKHWQWFLLLIGLSQIPVAAALVVVGWLIALGIRAKKHEFKSDAFFNGVQVGLAGLTLISLILLFMAVKQGLLGSPDMQIVGNHSSTYTLKWYQDRSAEILPTSRVISVPLMVYRLLMLIWSLWLAVSLLNWLKWGWECFSTAGLWKKNHLSKKSLVVKTPPTDSKK
ncbi:MAG: hypothetical protein Q9M50_10460 [Methylococcales bacterium]|nr:hypothetical protein [Methylococcales bacterium]